jgi:hypothetical protein
MAKTVLTGTILRSGSIPTTALGGGVVSSSIQIAASVPTGTVSSSAQVVAGVAAQTIVPSIINATGAISGASIQTSGNGIIGGTLGVTGVGTFSSTQDSTTGGLGSIVSSGGIYSTKRVLSATEMLVAKAGSDTAFAGPVLSLGNAANTKTISMQLDSTEAKLKWFYYPGNALMATLDSGGSLTLAGGLAITGAFTGATTGAFSSTVTLQASLAFAATSSQGAGSIAKNATYGLTYYGVAGSTNDFVFLNSAGSEVIKNPTGTQNITLSGTLAVSGISAFGTSFTDSARVASRINDGANPGGSQIGITAKSNFWATSDGWINGSPQIAFGASGTTYAPAAIGMVATSQTGNTYGDLVFATRSVTTDTQPTERFRITSTGAAAFSSTLTTLGNLGVGTASPTDTNSYGKAVDVYGVNGAGIYLRYATDPTVQYSLIGYDRTGAGLQIAVANALPLTLYTNNVARLTISSAGVATFSNTVTLAQDIQYSSNSGYGILSADSTRVVAIRNTGVNVTGSFAVTGQTTFNGTGYSVIYVAGSNGTYGTSMLQGWYRNDGTTLRAWVGYPSNNDQTFWVGPQESGGTLRLTSGAGTSALYIDSAQAATFAGTVTAGLVGKTGTYTPGSTTVDVTGVSYMSIANSSAISITNFTGAVTGQILILNFTDSNTTITRTICYLAGGANFTSTSADILVLVFQSPYWYEISRSANS